MVPPSVAPPFVQRFLDAQAPLYTQVLAELRRGCKQSHWMWFIFPQLAGLGRSEMARRYAIVSRTDAVAYTEHATLGARLLECTRLVCEIQGRSLLEIFDTPDDLKFASSMTLFSQVAREPRPYLEALARYCDSHLDERTLALLK